VVTNLPYARGWLLPPRGTAFLGCFYAIPDVYRYFSYVQQAEDGAWVFANKFSPAAHTPSFVDLEWSAVGALSVALGHQPALAFRCFGLLATLALLLAVDRWLRLSGLPERHRFAALVLVFVGGGAGGLLFLRFGPPAWRFLDLTTGMYPFISVLVNPHFVAGTSLLLWALWAFHRARDFGGHLLAVVLGSALVVVRPYELALLIGIRALVVLLTLPRKLWLASAVPLLCLAPAFAYGWLTLVANPAYADLASVGYGLPPAWQIGLALVPAAALAVAFATSVWRRAEPDARPAILVFLAWPATVVSVLFLPLAFTLQVVTNVGVPLLSVTALGLARFRPWATLAAAIALSSTALVALHLLLQDNAQWYVPRERLQTALALRPECRPGDLLLAPADIGLYANAYSACRAYVAHLGVPGAAERAAEVERFYAATPAERATALEAWCPQFVILPDEGPRPAHALGDAAPYTRTASVPAAGLPLAIYRRQPPRCNPTP
jgi:hypothetical protein